MTRLFLIVGNSGSGKDSLIREVQTNFPQELKSVKIPKRVITRPPSPETEDFESADEKIFLELKENKEFALDWHIYGLYYGVRKNVEEWMKEGHPVLINVSRDIIPDARKKYPDLKVIFVRVPFEVTTKRIADRGRETEEAMKERIERAKKNQDLSDADFVVDNSGNLAEAGKVMLKIVVKEYLKNVTDLLI